MNDTSTFPGSSNWTSERLRRVLQISAPRPPPRQELIDIDANKEPNMQSMCMGRIASPFISRTNFTRADAESVIHS